MSFEQNELIAMTEARHKLQVELTAMTAMAENFKSRFVEASRANMESTERIAALERERDALRAVLVGAEYERVDELPSRGVEFCKRLGEVTAERTKALRAEVERLRALLRECVEAMEEYRSLEEFTGNNSEWCKRIRAALGEGE